MKAHPDLVAQDAQLRKDVIELAPGIWTAVGFAASNVHMIEGADSVTIIDTTETTKAAENILAAFRGLTDKPVGRIILTHSHRDHISGAAVFSEGGAVPVLASHLFKSDLVGVDENAIAANKALMRRTMMQFGIGLPPDQRISLGIGPGDRPMEGMGAGFITPTERVGADRDIDLDGVPARLIHAPGETEDHLMVWLPGTRILFSGDNWYHAFPNLYAIRGTPYRDFQAWADSLELMRAHPDLETIYVPVGMGSGICSLITVRDLLGLETEIVGVVADGAPAYALSFDAGHPVPTDAAVTFADGMACREPQAEALAIIRAGAARILRLGEDEIAEAIRILYSDTHNVAEGAGAAPLAGLLRETGQLQGRKAAVILCGGNIDRDKFLTVLGGGTPSP